MIQFANPSLLLVGLAVPITVWLWQRARGRALRFPCQRALADLPAAKAKTIRWARLTLAALGLLALVASMAGPRWPDLRTRINTEGIAIAMVVDVSGSMAETDFEWNSQRIRRLEAVKRAFDLFVRGGTGPDGERFEGRPNDLICLTTFSTRPQNSWPLTLSHAPLLRILHDEEPRSLPTEAQTNIGDAIAWGLDRLASAPVGRRVMVLLSDGIHNVPPPALKPRQAAQLAAGLHVPIYAIDTGALAPTGESKLEAHSIDKDESQSGPRTLQTLASLTGGKYFRAHDAKSLLAVCDEVDRLERSEIHSFQYRHYHEAYSWFGLVSLICLLAIPFMDRTFWLRLP
jgi:Ca-activated chloride channel family protein